MQQGNTLQTRLDLPLWFKANLNASKKVAFYTVPGLNNISSINQALTIDKTAQYTCEAIQIAVLRTIAEPPTTAAWDAASVELLSKMIAQTWFNFLKNGREYVWSCAAASLLATPTPIPGGATSGWDISKSVQATYTLAEPIIIPGGQALNITQEWEATQDFTGLAVQMTMFGILDRDIARMG